jgi:polar amino acid transport system permease protein
MNTLIALWNEIATLSVPALFNLYFAAVAIPVGFSLAVLLTLGTALRNALLSRLCRAYIYFFRGSPFFIQLFAIYALALSFNLTVWKPLGWDWLVLNPLFLGPLILALNTAAYTAAIFHGAMLAVPRAEIDAARAFGMSPSRRFRAIVWPHLIRIAWPAYTNEVIFLFQATALIYFTLPIVGDRQDLMSKASELYAGDLLALRHHRPSPDAPHAKPQAEVQPAPLARLIENRRRDGRRLKAGSARDALPVLSIEQMHGSAVRPDLHRLTGLGADALTEGAHDFVARITRHDLRLRPCGFDRDDLRRDAVRV